MLKSLIFIKVRNHTLNYKSLLRGFDCSDGKSREETRSADFTLYNVLFMAKNTKLRDKDRAIRQAVRVNEVEIQIAKLFFFFNHRLRHKVSSLFWDSETGKKVYLRS